MKNPLSFLLVAVLACTVLIISSDVSLAASATDAPSRVINVVYDDSGSMITTGGQSVDTWCQAKYAMEVFAAMLGEKDSMNIYVMSDYKNSTTSGPRLKLNGADGAAENVAQVRNMITTASDTPFNSVRKAYSDLAADVADEKWLVVLTDGEFQGVDNVDAFFAQKAVDVSIMFLGMGPNADAITSNEANNLYFEKAQTNSEILSKITKICTRIFNTDKLEIDVSSKTISFDVPMAELVVFAQGANVLINGIQTADGKLIKSSSAPIGVRYSEQAATNYTDVKIATDLVGSIATFKDDFSVGDYTIDVSGAETIEIYYKPNIEIAAYLTDSSGNEVTQLANLEAGEYIIEFGFVKAGMKEKISQSSLLGNVSYVAQITSNGTTHDNLYSSGDRISLDEGTLQIDATASFLQYNSVSTFLEYSIFENKGISFSILDSPEYEVSRDGLANDVPIKLKALIQGNEFSEAQWNAMGVPTVLITDSLDFDLGEFEIEKSAEPGVYNIYPTLGRERPSTGTYDDCTFSIAYSEQQGNETWSGSGDGLLKLNDNRSWIERNWDLVVKWLTIGVILIFILGYVPPFKKYLPRKLKKSPVVDCTPMRPGILPMTAKGKYVKSIASTLIPYKAEVGTIRFVPPGVMGVPVLKVKGAGGNCMLITNVKAYAGKKNITFNGVAVEDGQVKLPKKSAGIIIAVNNPEMTYSCVPTRSK